MPRCPLPDKSISRRRRRGATVAAWACTLSCVAPSSLEHLCALAQAARVVCSTWLPSAPLEHGHERRGAEHFRRRERQSSRRCGLWLLGHFQIKAVSVHHLGPGCDEVVDEFLL